MYPTDYSPEREPNRAHETMRRRFDVLTKGTLSLYKVRETLRLDKVGDAQPSVEVTSKVILNHMNSENPIKAIQDSKFNHVTTDANSSAAGETASAVIDNNNQVSDNTEKARQSVAEAVVNSVEIIIPDDKDSIRAQL